MKKKCKTSEVSLEVSSEDFRMDHELADVLTKKGTSNE